MHYLGLDIGTTTICGVVIDENNKVLKSITRNNDSEIKSDKDYERIQNPDITFDIVKKIADELLDEYDDVATIGVSAQMHGILYYDKNGNAISPLYYWQDARALQKHGDDTYLSELVGLTGYNVSSGYGAATHYYNQLNNLVPEDTKGLCTIGDYVVMKLCGRNFAITHTSQAASIGLFDLKELCFDSQAISKAGMDYDLFPEVKISNEKTRYYRHIPVYVSVGDNQASFIGSGGDSDTILLNIGTGSQISLISEYTDTNKGIELRPLNNHKYLLVGAAICGGKSYQILRNFFNETAKMLNCEVDDMYSLMNNCIDDTDNELVVDTKFLGSRSNPDLRGSISNINDNNLTPANLVKGFNYGMAEELYELYSLMNKSEKNKLIGSGNACRNNKGLCKAIEKTFNMNLSLSQYEEEAARGAAIFTKLRSGINFSRTLKTHYKAKKSWLNDPNGLVYFKGNYHIFYQYSPNYEDPFFEPMYWGHAITKDFVNYEELPEALSPDKEYDEMGCWSGTAVVKDDRLYLFYASIVSSDTDRFGKQTVSVAYSDDGIHFEKYENNPVIREYPKEGSFEFRDPAVIDNGDTYYLVMATGNDEAKAARLVYYQSDDLLHWDYKGIMVEWPNKKYCECPSFTKYGDKYLLACSVCSIDSTESHFSIMYGDFDGHKFTPLISKELNKGPDQYAGLSFLDDKNRHIIISWITGWHFERYHDFSLGCLSTPIELKVVDNQIIGWPIDECKHLLKDDDEAIIHTEDGFIIKRESKRDLVYKGNIKDMKVIRDEYILEIFLNGGEEIYTVVLC